MKPLLAVVALCLTASLCLAETEEKPLEVETLEDGTEPQKRNERCTTCQTGLKVGFNPNDVLAKIQAIPGAEVHTQQSFEECSSDKGCAGIKVKDGRIIERFGNADHFKAAAAADTGNEFQFHAAGSFGNVFEGGIPNGGPYWWMNENSPFKNSAGNFEKFSKSSSSSYSSSAGGAGGGNGGATFTGTLDLSGNPFLNGKFAKTAGGLVNGLASGVNAEIKPGFQASTFESSSFSSNKESNQFPSASRGGFQAGFGNQASAGKFQASGYTGSSPSPFSASGANVNLIQTGQKASEFDFEQHQQQQNIDEAFQGTGNVHGHEHSGGDLQQTCAGQGYVCVHKAQCNNGVVNTNGAAVLQAKTKKQYCNVKTEICCRIEISTLQGAGGLQGSLGVGSATFSGSGNQGSQGSGLFVSSSQGSSSGSTGSSGSGVSGSGISGSGISGQAGFGQSSFESSSSSFGSSNNFGANRGQGSSTTGSGFNSGSATFGASGSGSSTSSGTSGQGASFGVNFGAGNSGSNSGTTGTSTFESSSSTFESRGTNFGQGSSASGNNGGKFGAGASGGFNGFGATASGTTTGNRFGGSDINTNTVYKQTSQTNFVENDSFSAGSENTGSVYRPGSGPGLKPGIPYLPPVDSSSSGSSISQTGFSTTVTTPRPFTTPRPTYLPPPVSTAAPGYLPPQVPEQTINTETRVPNPTYDEGQIILDETRPRPPRPIQPRPVGPIVNEIPSGCAAALKCTPIEYCTAEGVISNTTVILTKDQEAYRVPMTDCKDAQTGQVGKCCRDPLYTDPWPTNQLGKWVPGVFGGNDGKYSPDSRGSGSIVRPQVSARPPVTGSALLNNYNTPKPTPAYGPNQVTAGFPTTVSQNSYGQKGQFEVKSEGQFGVGGQGQFAQGGAGQFGVQGQGAQGQSQFASGSQYSTSQSFNQGSTQLGATRGQGQGQFAQGSQGQFAQGGQGQFAQGGQGQFGIGGVGQIEVQGQGAQGQFSQTQTQSEKRFGQTVTQGQGSRGQGQAIISGQGQSVSQGFGTGVRQGSGFTVSQGQGFGVENEYSESVQRVFLQQYSAGGTCGAFNGQKPYGNRNDLEVDFAEIPWQAMVLLQTNRSLLCGGVITRPDVVVTSAACVDGLQAKNVLIKGGEWKLGIDDEPLPFQIVQVKNILRHPFYKRGSLLYDVAILVLSENLRLAKNIYPICLPRAGETLDAFYNGAGECIVTGWGKQVLQAHLSGAILHSLNISLINPGECQNKLSQDYPHLLEQYDAESCACGQPLNPVNNICKVDTGSALACTTDGTHFVLRGVYSWDSGCQPGNQLAAFYKFDLEWYEWAIGLIESARFAQYSSGSQILSQNRLAGQINSGLGFGGGVKGGAKGGQGQFSSGQYSQFSQSGSQGASGLNFGGEIKGPITNSFSASYTEKKVFQSEPKIVTFTTKPEIVTFTTKPEYFTYTTKPKIVSYTTKPQIITYETSGSGTNPQYVAPGVTFNPSFSDVVGQHTHNANCKCLEGKK